MSTRGKWIRNIAIGIGGLIVIVVVAAVVAVQTDWFRNYVRETIVSSVEDDVGGRVEVGAFRFEPGALHATVDRFVIHGNEPAGAPPFVSIGRIEVYLRLFTSLTRLYEISYLGIDRPEVSVTVLPDGHTNIPSPRKKSTSDQSALKTVVDLAVGDFVVDHGLIALASLRQPLDIRGRNLQVQLAYSFAGRSYSGRLNMDPLYVLNGRNTPVNFKVSLPVTLAGDRIDLKNGSISTPLSTLALSGSMADMKNPRFSAQVNGHVAVEDAAAAGDLKLSQRKGLPSQIDVQASADVGPDAIHVAALNLQAGQSSVQASGKLRDAGGNGALDFRAALALHELGEMAALAQHPSGTLLLSGKAKPGKANDYQADGNVEAADVSFRQGARLISNVNLDSAFHADNHNLTFNDLRLRAFGGEFAGSISLVDFDRYSVSGNLRNFGIQSALAMAGEKLPYDGIISGPVNAAGDLKAGAKSLQGGAHLTIAPGKHGVPVSGRLNASYSGAADAVFVDNSYVALPHTRLTLSGSTNKRLDISLTSRDLNDLLAAVPSKTPTPVVLAAGRHPGEASFMGSVIGGLAAPRITGHLAANRFAIEGRDFQALTADLAASKSGASVTNGSLIRASLQASFSGSIGLHDWSAASRSPFMLNADLRNGDLADVIALAGQPPAGYSGMLTASAHVSGTVGNPVGSANLQAASGTAAGEPFNSIEAQVNLADQLVTIPAAYVDAPAGRISLTADYRHPRDSFSMGQVHAHVQSDQLDLARSTLVQKEEPNSGGVLRVNADVTGTLGAQGGSSFALTNVNADVTGRGFQLTGQNYGDFTATAKSSGRTVSYNLTSDFAGSAIKASGTTELTVDYPTRATATIDNLPIERVLIAAHQPGIPARGVLSGSIQVNGTLKAPEGSAQVDLTRAVVYGETIDSARLRATYLARSVDIPQFEIHSGPSRLQLTAHYDHPAGDFAQGRAQFRVSNSHIDLGRIHTIQQYRPGLAGAADLSASGEATIKPGTPRVLLTSLDATLNAGGIAAAGKNFGDLRLTANTTGANRLNFNLDSSLGGANIHAGGNATLAGEYPVDAQLTFRDVAWSRIADLLGQSSGTAPAFEATTEGQLSVKGPVLKTDQLNATLSIARLNLTTTPRAGAGRPIAINNQGPIQVSLDRGTVRIQNAHLTGSKTDLQATGSMALNGGALNLTVNGNADLSVIQNFDHDAYSAGTIVLATTVRGSTAQPRVNGQLTIRDVGLGYASLPIGLSNANGAVVFNGNTAQIRTLTADAGGGKISVTGFAGLGPASGGAPRFSVRTTATSVRVRIQQGVSVTADANIRLNGTTSSSQVAGDVTIDRVAYAPQSDLGSILTRSAPPVQAPEKPSPLLANMKLDVRVRSAPGMTVDSSLTQSLQADADLRVRGTADQPAVLGRVSISEGKLTFFGATYTVDTGTISFYDPIRINPILDVSLETQSKGVTVTLQVTGPLDNMKMSYTSDPPLQFQEIVQLLASGKTPTSDPTILANQPAAPQQSFQQMGESAILGQAVANPISSRLQRVFGVSQLKIDPSFTSGSNTPTASLALQQQITSNLTFTYSTQVDNPNAMLIRIEWAFDPRWSAVASRDENGIFSMNFFYKKSFR
jgi:translocation and assembly module TamB